MTWYAWIARPFLGVSEAKGELGRSLDDVERVQRLGEDLRKIKHENHIAQRVHRAARGVRE